MAATNRTISVTEQLQAAADKAVSPNGSFALLILAEDEKQAISAKDMLAAGFREILQFDLTKEKKDQPLEQGILLGTACYDAVQTDAALLLPYDFAVCFVTDLQQKERLQTVLPLFGGYVMLAVEAPALWQELQKDTYGLRYGICSQDKVARVIHGMVSIEGAKLRRKFTRHAIEICCTQQKQALCQKIELLQKRHTVRQDAAVTYFRKFVYHWNDSDNALSDQGDYLQLLEELLSRCDDPLTFQKQAVSFLQLESKAYFTRMGKKFCHALPRSGVCKAIADDFYRIVLDHGAIPPKQIGVAPTRFWNTLFHIPPKPIYNDYQAETLLHWKKKLLPALRCQLSKLLSALEEEYRSQTVYPDLTEYTEEYMKLVSIEQQLYWEVYL